MARSRHWVAGAAVLFVVAGALLVAQRVGEDGPMPDGRAQSSEDWPTTTASPSTTSPPIASADSSAAHPLPSAVPVAVAVLHDGRLEWHEPGGSTRVLVDEVGGRTVQAVGPGGEVLLTSDRWFESAQVVVGGGAVTMVELPGRSRVLNVERVGSDTFVEMMVAPDDDELGDIAVLELATGAVRTEQEDVVFLSQNSLPIARAAGVVVSEYVWVSEYEVDVRTGDGDPLPSPTDGRYGLAFGVRGRCPGAEVPLVDSPGQPVLDEDGSRLAWLNRVRSPDSLVRSDIRVLRLGDGVDGSTPTDPALGALVALRGDWAVLERGFVNVATGETLSLAGDGLIAAAGDAESSTTVPPGPIPVPACPDEGVSIYGLRDLVVGVAPPDQVLDEFWQREPDCWLLADASGEIAVHLDGTGSVLGIVVADFLESTPSGVRQGTGAGEIIARFGERLEAVDDGAALTALDFVPADPAESHLGLRFVLREGTVTEMWAGDRDFTRSAESCLLD